MCPREGEGDRGSRGDASSGRGAEGWGSGRVGERKGGVAGALPGHSRHAAAAAFFSDARIVTGPKKLSSRFCEFLPLHFCSRSMAFLTRPSSNCFSCTRYCSSPAASGSDHLSVLDARLVAPWVLYYCLWLVILYELAPLVAL